MTKFTTKAKLVAYLGTPSPREAKYIVLTDETLQNKKSVYQYTNEELILLSNEVKEFTWRTPVATYALLSGVTAPVGMDAIIVLADETHDEQPTQYYYDGYAWVYNGVYFKEELTIAVSDKNVRVNDITLDTDYTLPFKYVVGSGHLEIYLEEIALIRTIDFIEVGTLATVSDKVQFKSTIPKEARLIFRRNVSSNLDDTIVPRRGKVDIYYFDTFADAQNSPLLIDEGQVLRTFGHTTRNDGKGRYWILESTDKDFGYKNKANTLFINRMICADEKQIGEIFPLATGMIAPPESVYIAGQIANRADFKRVWAWAVSTGRVVTEAEWSNYNQGCFSSGDGVNTFRFPEIRGTEIRAFDGGRGIDVGRINGTYQLDSMQGHVHTLTYIAQFGGTTRDAYYPTLNMAGDSTAPSLYPANTAGGTFMSQPTDSGYGTPRITTENRTKNTAEPYYIKI